MHKNRQGYNNMAIYDVYIAKCTLVFQYYSWKMKESYHVHAKRNQAGAHHIRCTWA